MFQHPPPELFHDTQDIVFPHDKMLYPIDFDLIAG